MGFLSKLMGNSGEFEKYATAIRQRNIKDQIEFRELYNAIPSEEKEEADNLRKKVKDNLSKEIMESLSYDGIFTRMEEYLDKVKFVANIMVDTEEQGYWSKLALSLMLEYTQLLARDDKMCIWEMENSDGHIPEYGEINTEAILYLSMMPSRDEDESRTIEEVFDESYERFSACGVMEKPFCKLPNLVEYLWHFVYYTEFPDIKRFEKAYEMYEYYYGLKIEGLSGDDANAAGIDASAAAAFLTALTKGDYGPGFKELMKTMFYFAIHRDIDGCEKVASLSLALANTTMEYSMIQVCKDVGMELSPLLEVRYTYLSQIQE